MIEKIGSEAMTKFYAVRKGKKTGIFKSWKECESQVKGYSGAEYKSFSDHKSANEYLNSKNGSKQDSENIIKVYVDGSYSKVMGTAGYGCVFIEKDEIIHKISKSIEIDPQENLWNVSAEIEGVLGAVEWAIKKKLSAISIYYDYEGLKNWVDGSWKANKHSTKSYIKAMKAYSEKIEINFFKVKAHSGNRFNEMADELAKSALEIEIKKEANKSEDELITISLSEYKKIIGNIDKEECLIETGDLRINESLLKKVAKKVWRDKKYLIKDIGRIHIRFEVTSSIMHIEITSNKDNSSLKLNIKLESA